MSDLATYAQTLARRARDASRVLAAANGEQKIAWLARVAERIRSSGPALTEANALDIARAPEYNLNAASVDRLRLDERRLTALADGVDAVAHLRDPIGEILDSNRRPNGLLVTRVSVPLGVIFFIYESRPSVTIDAATLCVKSGNAVILRGGKEALESNRGLYRLLRESLEETGLPGDSVQLVETIDREAVGHFLRCHDHIDVAIPRGGKSLIERVTAEAQMPVIKHFAGVCHVYVDRSADLEMAEHIVVNGKCQRPGVCNATESLLVHADVASTFLPRMGAALSERGVEMKCCERSLRFLPGSELATDDDFRTEYLDLKLSIKTVDRVQDAIAHINEFGSHHTDAIVTRDTLASELFARNVDSAAVHLNASTRFNDGGEYGLGAEIGISTDKFHARGPCGLRELTSYKYVVHGQGQTRD
ncbi:MAG: glutamate-5-semialdehyde dehydrogenase [Planctomycetaceae bacterium]